MTMKSTDCRTCCDGECNQGRDCPLVRDDPDPLRDDLLETATKVVLLGIGIVVGGVITIGLLAHL